MPRLGYYVLGDWNSICDVCGRGFKFSSLRKRWDNAWTCDACWEERQPQDFVRSVRDDQSVPVGRPRIGLPSSGFIWSSNITPVMSWTNVNGDLFAWANN